MLSIGSFVRVTRDAVEDEPLVEGMVGKVVADLYGRADPGANALVVMAGARKPCVVPLDAVVPISASDYGDESLSSRQLWRERRKLWRKRNGPIPLAVHLAPDHGPDHHPASDDRDPAVSATRLRTADLILRAEAVQPEELEAIASPALLGLLTEWSVAALDVLAELLPAIGEMPYRTARELRVRHVERWLWEGVRLYLSVRTFHPRLPPVRPEWSRERVRSLFERIDDGEPSERLAEFSLDVGAVKKAMTAMTRHWLGAAGRDFARGVEKDDPSHEVLSRYVLQLHIAGFQAAFCADSANHLLPVH